MRTRTNVTRIRVMVAVAFAATAAVLAEQENGWHARPEAIAQAAKQQPGFNYDESRVEAYTLPDLLAHKGKHITSAATWPARRAEILDLFRANVYGRSPGKPEHLAFTILEEDAAAMDGAAT